MKTISIKDVKKGMILKVKDLYIPAFGVNQWSRGYGAYTLPTQLFLAEATYVGNNYYSLSLTHLLKDETDTLMGGFIFPVDYEFLIPDEEEQQAYRDKLNTLFEKNIQKHLAIAMTVGSDPEIFVENKDGQLMPAFDFLGSKKNPLIINQLGYADTITAAYWDGFQAEFTTRSNTCLSFHIDSIQAGLKAVLNAARKKDAKAKLSIKTVFDISHDLLNSAKDEHVEFGCMPSYNAYGMEGNKVSGRLVPFRPSGGHIHLGVTKRTPEEYAKIVKVIDAIAGVACVALAANFDDPRRRSLYGLAGEYRLPPHGVEYRVLSNFWLCHPLVTNMVFDLVRKAYVLGEKGLGKIWNANEAEVIETINNCDVAKAKAILERNKEVFLKILESNYCPPYARAGGKNKEPIKKEDMEYIYAIYLNGLESVIKDPTDIVTNWRLDGMWDTHANNDAFDVATNVALLSKGKKVA